MAPERDAPLSFEATHVGKRSYWQDRHVVAEPALPAVDAASTPVRVAAVFDGHGTPESGEAVAELLRARFVDALRQQPAWRAAASKGTPAHRATLVADALRSLVPQLEDEANKLSAARRDYFGSTLCAVLALHEHDSSTAPVATSGNGAAAPRPRVRTVITANVGDSRAVLASGDWEASVTARDLTVDHRPTYPAERKRIEAAGGWVSLDLMLNGYIGTSRGIGDQDLKAHRNVTTFNRPSTIPPEREFSDQLYIATPDVEVHDIGPGDHFLIVASDGIWHVLTSEEAVKIAHKAMRGLARDPAKALVSTAVDRGVGDNVTALVVPLSGTVQEVLEASSSLKGRLNGGRRALFRGRKQKATLAQPAGASEAAFYDGETSAVEDVDGDPLSDDGPIVFETQGIRSPRGAVFGSSSEAGISITASQSSSDGKTGRRQKNVSGIRRWVRKGRRAPDGGPVIDDLTMHGAHNYPGSED